MSLCRTLADIEAAAAQDPPDPVRPQEWADRTAAILAPHMPARETQAA
jgi:hypothetical protein